MQVRRELVDVARKYRSAKSFARHHETNSACDGECWSLRSDAAVDPSADDHDGVASWTRFHDAATALNDDDRELFNLVWYLGLNREQAAHALGCSVRTVARRWDLLKRHIVSGLDGQAPT
jgi:DNA-directed RNA polymerase specialized sigma24 family protein